MFEEGKKKMAAVFRERKESMFAVFRGEHRILTGEYLARDTQYYKGTNINAIIGTTEEVFL
jgi:hypothetical protein